MITRFSIVTLIFFILSITFVIYPVSFTLRIPYLGRRKIPINLATAPILAIAILWASQCLGATQIRDGIVGTDGVKPYNILILFFSLAYMAITLDISGLLQAAAFWVSNKGGSSGWKLFFYFYIMLTLTSVIVGNDPVILSGTVFLVYYTTATGLEPMPWLISEFAAANTASMVLFVGNPTNVVICEGFNIINAAFTVYTILPFLGCSVFCFIALAFQFRNARHVPRKLPTIGHLNVRGVLRDPFGALAGSLILGSCLIIIIVVSFFHIDVWKISLPFAGVKLIFDFVWDHIRSVRKCRLSGDTQKSGLSGAQPVEDVDADPMLSELRRAMSKSSETGNVERNNTFTSGDPTLINSPNLDGSRREDTVPSSESYIETQNTHSPKLEEPRLEQFASQRPRFHATHRRLAAHFPTFFTALPRLPFGLVPFAFSQFILIEALQHQGWIEVFANWLVRASHRSIHSSIWLVGVLGVILCNCSGTNIGATILLTKVVRAADLPPDSTRAAGIALAVASNIGAVSFTFSASLAGLLWTTILGQKDIHIKQREFAFWNLLPILVMTAVGLGIVSAEMAVLY
ncbi:uncharacterized protein BT62DRAFT_933041 [Guyanagaster necrorhizus]|uniref:Citrate transporter-like domain-containing protein n=1 Tax=Guyanagaster necrorhizus TaxID=856835 RepID=A0A9P7VPW8_9AGAR|nr:uncharacterized protein BT62DRAFT_933041 [Guyanagaster necrorhizus MCA 3950]KAG7445231.1 hypothetical protein BT62DRAFT_933041 [Guyanagaster necrorhizus MCA 3950]